MLDLNSAFTTQDVANLLASKDDSEDRQIRVDTAGIAYLSDEVGALNLTGVAFRFETFDAGGRHTGPEAAADANFVARIEAALRANWPKPTSTYLELY
ncbi:hypothetical protein [Caulobacter sp. RHG1]|uniref:hypothetical protein n=1 Tax=Caulobacter sp. (strain RHG1) TaxID=2545762 RepID=UPI00155810BB|nr:hypothetical protein [Caulobacter sp. RHG1]